MHRSRWATNRRGRGSGGAVRRATRLLAGNGGSGHRTPPFEQGYVLLPLTLALTTDKTLPPSGREDPARQGACGPARRARPGTGDPARHGVRCERRASSRA
jgi:hypothetical protein